MGNLLAPSTGPEIQAGVSLGPLNYITPEISEQIISKQQELISKLQQAKMDVKLDIPPETFTDTIEHFDIAGQPLTAPFSLPLSRELEVNDISNAYNQAINILDNQQIPQDAAFNAYIHLQNKKIAKLEESIASFPTNPNILNNPIKAIKNLHTSNLLNVEEFPNPAYSNASVGYTGNGSSKYPNYLIYGNNGCLSYDNSGNTYEFKPCNANDAKQRFNMERINTIEQYNAKITDPKNQYYLLNSADSMIPGFYVVNPENIPDKCVNIGNDGLSVMPCNMQNAQRFKPYYHSISP